MKLIFIILLLLTGNFLSASDNVTLLVSMQYEKTETPIVNGKLYIYENDSLIETLTSNKLGQVRPYEELETNKMYTIKITKTGYVPKTATLNTTYEGHKKLLVFNMNVSLFEATPDHNCSFLENTPVVKFNFDKKGRQAFDTDYTQSVLEEIESCKVFSASLSHCMDSAKYYLNLENYDMAKQFFEERESLKSAPHIISAIAAVDFVKTPANDSKQDFNHIIMEADMYYKQKHYLAAEIIYKRALMIKPEDSYTSIQIGMCEEKQSW